MTDLFIAFLAMVLLAVGETAVLESDFPAASLASVLWPLAVPAVALVAGALFGLRIDRAARSGTGLHALYQSVQRSLFLLHVLSLLAFAALMLASDWVLVVRQWISPDVPLVPRLLMLLPFPLAVLAGRAALSRATRRARAATAARSRDTLREELRPLTMALGMFLLMASVEDLRWHFPTAAGWIVTTPGVLIACVLAGLALALTFSPYVVRMTWRTSSLSPGDLRTRFESLADRARVPVRDIRVWHTGSRGWLNAMIAGVLGRFRCIFMTDALLATLTTPDLEQVFSHELGHARLQHFVIYMLVALTLLLLLAGVVRHVPEEPAWQWAALLVGGFLYLRVFFGALSRQLESESDLFAARLTGSTTGTMSCLVRIGELAGGRTQRRTWRHPSVSERVTILLRSETSPEFRAAFHARTRRLLGLLAVLLVTAVGLVAHEIYRATTAPRHHRELELASLYSADYHQRTLRAGRRAAMESQLLVLVHDHLMSAEQDLAGDPGATQTRIDVLRWLGDVQERLDDGDGAASSRHRAAELEQDLESRATTRP